MLFVYVLAAIGLVALIALAVVALDDPPEKRAVESDPYDEALNATARMQASAWEAVQELRALDDGRRV
jgi:hypothetical protein